MCVCVIFKRMFGTSKALGGKQSDNSLEIGLYLNSLASLCLL